MTPLATASGPVRNSKKSHPSSRTSTPPELPPNSKERTLPEGREDIAVVADVYNSMLIAGKIHRLVEKNRVPFLVEVKAAESVELAIAIGVFSGTMSGVAVEALKGLYAYLKRRRKSIAHRKRKYPKTRQHIKILRASVQARRMIGRPPETFEL